MSSAVLYVKCPVCKGERVTCGQEYLMPRPCETCEGEGYLSLDITINQIAAAILREPKGAFDVQRPEHEHEYADAARESSG